ncbi:MAG: hypothetical protein AAF502_14010 [Bacteroidota bacterium]
MKNTLFSTLILLFGMVFLTSCTNNQSSEQATEEEKVVIETMDSLTNELENTIETLETEASELDNEIDDILKDLD